jgi:hypothetical protein
MAGSPAGKCSLKNYIEAPGELKLNSLNYSHDRVGGEKEGEWRERGRGREGEGEVPRPTPEL